MFRRFSLYSSATTVASDFHVETSLADSFKECYNIGPGDTGLILHAGKNRERTLSVARWTDSILSEMPSRVSITRDEIVRSPSYVKLFQRKRCLIVMNGYFDWKMISPTLGIPFYFRILEQNCFAVAGLYNPDTTSDELNFTPIQTDANEIVEPLSSMMPAILSHHDFDVWLDPLVNDNEMLLDMLKPFSTIDMASYRVHLQENDRTSNNSSLIQPII